MFSCFICSKSCATINEHIKHLRLIHSLFDHSGLQLTCAVENCYMHFQTFSGYRKHLRNYHAAQTKWDH